MKNNLIVRLVGVKIYKNSSGAIFKMVDEVEYFVTLFTQTYDDLNSGIYTRMKQEVGSISKCGISIERCFFLDEDSIKNKLLQKWKLNTGM